MRFALVPLLVALTGCKTVAQGDFIDEYQILYCQSYEDCATPEMLNTATGEDCYLYFRQLGWPDTIECRYDARKAYECLEGQANAGCDGRDPDILPVCEEVYSGCALPSPPRVDEE